MARQNFSLDEWNKFLASEMDNSLGKKQESDNSKLRQMQESIFRYAMMQKYLTDPNNSYWKDYATKNGIKDIGDDPQAWVNDVVGIGRDGRKNHLDEYYGKGGIWDGYSKYKDQWASVGQNYDGTIVDKFDDEKKRIYAMLGLSEPGVTSTQTVAATNAQPITNSQPPQTTQQPITTKPYYDPLNQQGSRFGPALQGQYAQTQKPQGLYTPPSTGGQSFGPTQPGQYTQTVKPPTQQAGFMDPGRERFGPALNGQYAQATKSTPPPGPAQNNYLQTMTNMANGNFGNTGQAMGQPMAQPQQPQPQPQQQQGTFSQLHNVWQKPGSLARSF